MKTLKTLALLIAIGCWPGVTCGQIGIVSNAEPTRVFFGGARRISLTIQNSGDQEFEGAIRMLVFQTTSATAVQTSEVFWKTLRVFPGQALVETAYFDFPTVRSETPFLIQWLDGANRVIGKTEVLVYPTNLLAELQTLAGDNPLGVFDPDNLIKPLLKMLRVEFADLENVGLGNFTGKLAIIGPFSSKLQMREGMGNQIAALARKGKAIVWILPPPEPHAKLQPSFYVVPEGSGCIVVAQADMVSNLAENPRAQLNLLHFTRLTLRPEPPRLPLSSPP